MTDRQRVAEWLHGKKRVHVDDIHVYVYQGFAKRFNPKTHFMDYRYFSISTLDDCRRFEVEAFQRGLFAAYANALEPLVDIRATPHGMTFREFAFLTATVEQRVAALVRVIEGRVDGETVSI